MIILRAIRGEEYARKIENGIISFRDVLSSITNDIETGYDFSNYNEEYFQWMLVNHMIRPANFYEFSEAERNKLLLIYNQTAPYMYLTYFHILNKNSVEDWLNKTDDDMLYIYIEPIIDSISNNMIGKNYIGKKLEYTCDLNEVNKDDAFSEMLGCLQFMDIDISNGANFEHVLAYCNFFMNLCIPLFFRVEDPKFTSKENEFRILYKVPTYLSKLSKGICPEIEREYRVKINDKDIYRGKTVIECHSHGIKSCDMELIAENPLLSLNRTSLNTEVIKGNKFNIISQFMDLNIGNKAKRYGYIGNKEDCLKFINRELKNTP